MDFVKEFLTYALIFSITGFLMRYMTSKSQKKVLQNKDGVLILKPLKLLMYFGMLAIFVGIFLILIFLITSSNPGVFVALILADFFLVGGLYLLIFYLKHKIEIINDQVISYSFWRKPIEISFKEIIKVSFSNNSMYLKISDKTKKIRVSMYLIGFQSFIDILTKNLDGALLQKALLKIEKSYKIWNP